MRPGWPLLASLVAVACQQRAPSPPAPEPAQPVASAFSPMPATARESEGEPVVPAPSAAASVAAALAAPTASASTARAPATAAARPRVVRSFRERGLRWFDPEARRGGPSIRTDGMYMRGTYEPALIRRIMRQNMGRLRMCYERGLAQDPNLQGRIDFIPLFDRDGAMRRVDIHASELTEEVTECMREQLLTLTFPAPPAGEVEFYYPLSFSPGA